MQYFQDFSTLYYNIKGQNELVIDILKRALIKSNVINNIDAYLEYTVKEGDNLQSISYNLYDSVYPFWVILLINQELNPYYCLPLSDEILYKQAVEKYGEEHLNDTHHYEDKNGNIIDHPIFQDLHGWYRIINGEKIYINKDLINQNIVLEEYQKISNWEYEIKNNEKKRTIKLLRPEYLDFVIEEFNSIVR